LLDKEVTSYDGSGFRSNAASSLSLDSVSGIGPNAASSLIVDSVSGLMFELSSSSRVNSYIDSCSSSTCTSSPGSGSDSESGSRFDFILGIAGSRSNFCLGLAGSDTNLMQHKKQMNSRVYGNWELEKGRARASRRGESHAHSSQITHEILGETLGFLKFS